MNCRFCGHPLSHQLIDLASAPASNSFLTEDQLNEPEVFYPLKLFVCDACFLVQTDEYKTSREIFNSGYLYFSSFSKTWLDHAKDYVEMIVERFGYDQRSRVIEIASNDGYLLQYFQEKGVPVLGIEPAAGTAAAAEQKGIETIVEFFGKALAKRLARQDRKADLLIGNNVLAHVPDLNDFVAALKIALKSDGVITMEFPHLMQLIDKCQFDTIYHEHFSYLSFLTVQSVFHKHGLEIFMVEELPTHGGSLRIFAKHAEDETKIISPGVSALLEKEKAKGMNRIAYYAGFQARVDSIKYELLKFLIEQKQNGKRVIAYGAAAKGNTLLNYCGIRKDLLEFVVDASPYKQGKYLPGSHIPVLPPTALREEKPHIVLILPWNITDEIMQQHAHVRGWGGIFVSAIPEMIIIA
jgi:2-polyprenyl-3-methyl-5-hydroxy-6-metoxy-1,4-benzoquinol methylase